MLMRCAHGKGARLPTDASFWAKPHLPKTTHSPREQGVTRLWVEIYSEDRRAFLGLGGQVNQPGD